MRKRLRITTCCKVSWCRLSISLSATTFPPMLPFWRSVCLPRRIQSKPDLCWLIATLPKINITRCSIYSEMLRARPIDTNLPSAAIRSINTGKLRGLFWGQSLAKSKTTTMLPMEVSACIFWEWSVKSRPDMLTLKTITQEHYNSTPHCGLHTKSWENWVRI